MLEDLHTESIWRSSLKDTTQEMLNQSLVGRFVQNLQHQQLVLLILWHSLARVNTLLDDYQNLYWLGVFQWRRPRWIFNKRCGTMSSLNPFHACHAFDPTPKRAVSIPWMKLRTKGKWSMTSEPFPRYRCQPSIYRGRVCTWSQRVLGATSVNTL